MTNQTGLNFFHLVLRLTANSVMLNFVTHVYLFGLTLDCQWNKAQFLLICLLTWTYHWLPVLFHILVYLDLPLTASLTRLNSFNRLDHLYLLILKNLSLIQKPFLNLIFFIFSLAALYVGAYSTFRFSSFFIIPLLPVLVSFFFQSFFFIFSSFHCFNLVSFLYFF